MSDKSVQKIIIAGAGGNVGGTILESLLKANQFRITVVTRSGSTDNFPEAVTVKKGSYDDVEFLESVFSGQEVAIFALNFMAMDEQAKLIESAAKSGVEWIIPTEYAGDGTNDELVDKVAMFQPKRTARKQIEQLSKTYTNLKYIGVATNPWTEFSLQMGLFDINIRDRTATLHSDAKSFNSSTLHQVGLGVTRLLCLPIQNEADPKRSLTHYGNGFVFISSFLTNQSQLLESAMRATGTKRDEWKIEHSTIVEKLRKGNEALARGDMMGAGAVTYAMYMGGSTGGNYEVKAAEDRSILAMEEENLDEVVAAAVASLQ